MRYKSTSANTPSILLPTPAVGGGAPRSSSSKGVGLVGHWSSRCLRVAEWLWHYRSRFLLGAMQDAAHSDRHTPTTRWLHCLRSSLPSLPTFDALVVANHTYFFISLGYVLLNCLRILCFTSAPVSASGGLQGGGGPHAAGSSSDSDSSAFAPSVGAGPSGSHGSHWRLLLLSDSAMLMLAALLVLDSLIFAYVHARSLPLATLLPPPPTRDPQQSEGESLIRGPRVTTLRVEPAEREHEMVEMQALMAAPADPASPSPSPSPSPDSADRDPSVVVAVRPTIARHRSNALPERVNLHLGGSGGRGRSARIPLTWRTFTVVFLATAEGHAELLNVAGSLGYLITALIPFLFFVVSRDTERSLDRAANAIDNLAMLLFVADSFLYLRLWMGQPPRAKGDDDQRDDSTATKNHQLQLARKRSRRLLGSGSGAATADESEECELLIDLSATNGNGAAPSSSPSSSPKAAPSSIGGSAVRSVSVAVSASPSSSGTAAPRGRSPCDRREQDVYLLSNALNILGGLLYLASTIYGFVIRLAAEEQLEALRTLADSASATPSQLETGAAAAAAAGVAAATAAVSVTAATHVGGTLRRGAALLLSARAGSSEVPSRAPAHVRALPSFPSWEAAIAAQFHSQQVVALLGDIAYFFCAVCMEIAYYRSVARARRERRERADWKQAEGAGTDGGGDSERGRASDPTTPVDDDDDAGTEADAEEHGDGSAVDTADAAVTRALRGDPDASRRWAGGLPPGLSMPPSLGSSRAESVGSSTDASGPATFSPFTPSVSPPDVACTPFPAPPADARPTVWMRHTSDMSGSGSGSGVASSAAPSGSAPSSSGPGPHSQPSVPQVRLDTVLTDPTLSTSPLTPPQSTHLDAQRSSH